MHKRINRSQQVFLITMLLGIMLSAIEYNQGIWGDGKSRESNSRTESADEPGKEDNTAQASPKVAITFDDGPKGNSTEMLLDGLKERGVKASFFVIGRYAADRPEQIKRIYDEGHLIGNHTYNHVDIAHLSDEEAAREIQDTSDLIEEITGHPTEFVRPPFGAWQGNLEEELDVMAVEWNVDPLDWTTKNVDEIVNRVVTKTDEGDIILLHDCYESSVKAALRIIDILQSEGYDFVTVDELLLD